MVLNNGLEFIKKERGEICILQDFAFCCLLFAPFIFRSEL